MVECPLYADPELYDRLFPNADGSGAVRDEVRRERIAASERFYLEEARRSGGPILELGCGSGRLTIPIAREGIEIVGADLSHSMLETARAKARAAAVSINFVQADMRQFELPATFAAILIPGNSLLHLLHNDDLKACLACVRRHLAAGGRLILDVSRWDPERHSVLQVHDPQRGEITIEETSRYDAATQIRYIAWHFSAPGQPSFRVIEYVLRVIFPEELVKLLEAAGFRLEARYGEFTRVPFDPSSPRQVAICSVAS